MSIKNTFKHSDLFVLLYSFLLLSNLLILLSLVTGNTNVERMCSYLILILAFTIYVYAILIDGVFRNSDIAFIVLIIYILSLAVIKDWSYENIVSSIVFLSMLTVWRGAGTVSCNAVIQKIIRWGYVIQGIILIVLFFSPLAYKSYQEYVPVSKELTLGFSNPNQTGIIIYSTIAVLFLASFNGCGKKIKILLLAESTMLSYMLILTDARTSIIGLLVLLIFGIFKKNIKKHYVLSYLIICFPLLFVYLYIALSKTSLANIVVMGKKMFSGRQDVYLETLNNFSDKLFGNLDIFNFSNAHNALLTILVNIGVIGLILYLLFSIKSFKSFYTRCNCKEQMVASVIILTFFIMGCSETAILTGGTLYFVNMFSVLQISYSSTEISGGVQ